MDNTINAAGLRPSVTRATRWLLAILVGVGAGLAAAHDFRAIATVIGALAFAAVAYFGFRAAFALWIPTFFVTFLGPGNSAFKAGAAIVAITFVVICVQEWALIREAIRASAAVLGLASIFLGWLVLSSLWADHPMLALRQARWYGLCLFIFVAIVTTVRTRRHLQAIFLAFIVGAAITTAVALAGVNDRSTDVVQHAGVTVQSHGARLEGGTGDPNVFAAALLAAIALAGGLALGTPHRARRIGLLAGMAVLAGAALESQSRGGVIAAGVATMAALLVLRPHRAKVAAMVLALGLGVWLSGTAGSVSRITNFGGDKGDGRVELWRIAWQMVNDHPIQGVGLQNFIPNVPRYVLSPGSIQFIRLLIEKPVVVHNTYLQFLAETGIVGFALFSMLVLVSLYSMLTAATLFERAGDTVGAALCRSAFVSATALLVAGFFFSSGVDYKMWIVLAIGPTSLALVRGRADEQTCATQSHDTRYRTPEDPHSGTRQHPRGANADAAANQTLRSLIVVLFAISLVRRVVGRRTRRPPGS